jgi:ABC-2 type transport system permease protein
MELNPILARELRTRARRVSGTVLLTIFLLLMVAVAAVVWGISNVDQPFRDEDSFNASRIGLSIFDWVVTLMTFLVVFIAPSLTAPSIAGERDRQTLIPLQVSLLKPRGIVLGKLSAALAFTLLIIGSAAPVFGVTYVIGGVTAGSIIRAVLGLAILAVLFGSIGVLCSTLTRRTTGAIVSAYGLTLSIVLLFPIFAAIIGAFSAFGGGNSLLSNATGVLLASHPFAFMSDFTMSGSASDALGPLTGANSGLEDFSVWLPVWIWQLMAYSFVCFGCLYIAARRIRTPAERER